MSTSIVLESKPRGIKLIGYPDLFGLRPAPRLEITGEINVSNFDIQIHILWDSFFSHFLHELCDGIEDGVRVGLEIGTSCIGELFRLHKNHSNSREWFGVSRGRPVTQSVESG